MKTIVISRKEKELARFRPDRRSNLLGRSPSCEVVVRNKGIEPVHFLLEWIGEGEFNAEVGFWTILDLSKSSKNSKNKSSGEGLVLSKNAVLVEDIEFKIVEDELAQSNLRKGILKRTIDELNANEVIRFGAVSCLEIVYFRKDVERVVNIRHLQKQDIHLMNRPFPHLPLINIFWSEMNNGLPIIENKNENSDFEIFNRNDDLTDNFKNKSKKIDMKSSDFISINSKDFSFYLRLVPFVEITPEKFLWLKDPILQSFLFVAIIATVFGFWMGNLPAPISEPPLPPERIATVEVSQPVLQEVAPPPSVDVIKNDIVDKPIEKPQEKIKEEIQIQNESKKDKVAAAPSLKNSEKSIKNKAGLNNPAPVKDVNTLGLLAKLKGGKKSNQTVSAELALNKGVVSEVATGDSGFVVSQPPAGVLGSGKKGGGDGADNGLAAASTTLQNSQAIDKNSVGALAVGKGTSKFSSGTQLSGLEGAGAGRGDKNLGSESGSMDVAGGLDKEAVRAALKENKRAITNCYETALMSKKELEGRVVLKWQINPDGKVDTIAIKASSLNIPSLENCITDVVKGIIFPQAANRLSTVVTYPFVFQGRK
ncbi:MAG: AgmX/PglI C-terminal domain-containing protein [Pseudobdellovibrionaceae bacterium]